MEPRIFPIYPPSAALFGKVLAASFAVITAFFAVLTSRSTRPLTRTARSPASLHPWPWVRLTR